MGEQGLIDRQMIEKHAGLWEGLRRVQELDEANSIPSSVFYFPLKLVLIYLPQAMPSREQQACLGLIGLLGFIFFFF